MKGERFSQEKEIQEGIDEYEFKKSGEQEIDKLDEAIQNNLISPDDFLYSNGENAGYDVYDWYAKAISRRNREPLSEENFMYHFFEGGSTEKNYMFGDMEKGFLLGILKDKVFIPTHFAPKSAKGGYELMSQLATGELAAALAITEDLAETLKKMPEWKIEDIKIPSSFRDEEVKKVIAHNRHPQVRKMMVGLLADYLGKTHEEISKELENFKK